MRRLLLRQTSQSPLPPDEAERVVRACSGAQLVARDGKTMLVDVDPAELASLSAQLDGWLVADAGQPLPVPDSCLHIKR